jgi:hypothetical protein
MQGQAQPGVGIVGHPIGPTQQEIGEFYKDYLVFPILNFVLLASGPCAYLRQMRLRNSGCSDKPEDQIDINSLTPFWTAFHSRGSLNCDLS